MVYRGFLALSGPDILLPLVKQEKLYPWLPSLRHLFTRVFSCTTSEKFLSYLLLSFPFCPSVRPSQMTSWELRIERNPEDEAVLTDHVKTMKIKLRILSHDIPRAGVWEDELNDIDSTHLLFVFAHFWFCWKILLALRPQKHTENRKSERPIRTNKHKREDIQLHFSSTKQFCSLHGALNIYVFGVLPSMYFFWGCVINMTRYLFISFHRASQKRQTQKV